MSSIFQYTPSVSVIIAAHNEEAHVGEALISIANQKDISFEVVFVDDHSDDGTMSIVEAIAADYSHVRVYRNPYRGKCSAFNFGVSQSKGRFVCIFAGDDIMPAGSLKERYDAVASESDDRCLVGVCKLVTMSDDKRFDGHLIPKVKGRGALSGVSPLMNRKAVSVIFPTPESLPNEDTWMELAVLHMPNWKIIHSDTVCCQWRCHAGNSINLTLPFAEFNRRISVRMDALELFMGKFGSELDKDQYRALQAKIDLENARRRGDWWAVLRSRAGLIDRLRALSMTNAIMYSIRTRFYGLLSGW